MLPKDLSFGPGYSGPSAQRGDNTAVWGRGGFTVLELVMVLILLAATSVIAFPSIERMRVDASVQNARHAMVSSVTLARATAMKYGRPAVLRIDDTDNRVWVEVDTTLAGDGGIVTLGTFHFAESLNVNISSNRANLCFDGRGVGTTTAACPVAGAAVVLSRSQKADTVVVSAFGRVMP